MRDESGLYDSGQHTQTSGWALLGLCACLGTALVGGAYGYATWGSSPTPSSDAVSQTPRVLPALAKAEPRLRQQLGLYDDYLRRQRHALPEHLQTPVEVDLSTSVAIRRTLSHYVERFEVLKSAAIPEEAKQLAYVWHPACNAGVMCWDCCEQQGITFMLEKFPKFHR